MTVAPPRQSATDQWPGLHTPPTGPRARIAGRVARKIFRAAVSRLHVSVHVDGETLGLGGPEMTIHRSDEFFARVGNDSLIGFGEAYLTGAWDADDLSGFLTVLAADLTTLVPQPLQKLRALWVARPPAMHRNTETNTRDNIAHHYDLSNDLFDLFLDHDAELLVGAVPHHVRPGRRPPRRRTADRHPRPRRCAGPQDRAAARRDRTSVKARGSSRSAPAGVSWPSAPPAAAPPSTRSPSRPSSRRSPGSGSRRPDSATGSTSSCATTGPYRASTTPSCPSR